MDDIRFRSSSDFLIWRQAVIDYIQKSRATHIHLNIRYPKFFNSEDRDIKPILDSLVGSDVTELNLGRTDFTDKIQDLTEILSKTKIEKVNADFCTWAADDFIRLMAVLKKTRVTKLDVSVHSNRLQNPYRVKKLITNIVNSHLRVLDGYWFCMLPNEKLLVQRLPDTKITRIDLSSVYFYLDSHSRQKQPEWVYLLISILPRTVITDLSFENIKFGDDIAKALSSVLGKSKLEKLSLQYTMLTDFGVDILANGLINSKLTHLNLKGNDIKGNNNFGRCLKNTKIRHLDLSYNAITKKKMFSDYNFLQGSPLTSLQLGSCYKKDVTLALHLKKLKFSKLKRLDLSANKLDDEQISALADVLSNSGITQLNLGSKPLSFEYTTLSLESVNILSECLKTSKLQHISLRATSGKEGLVAFMEKTKGSTVISVNLSNNYLNCGLNETLKNLTILALDFERNCLEKSITSFAEQLTFTSIVELNLNENDLRDDGALILAQFLEETQIVRLSLCYNSISNQGAEAIALVLKKTKIRQLNLQNNKIEDDGLESLAENARNSCITYLNIEGNPAAGTSKLLVDGVICENRRRIKIFAESVNRTAFFTGGDSDIFEFDRSFDGINIDDFIEDCLKLYCFVEENTFIVDTIEQDKCTSGLRNLKRFDCDTNFFDDGEFFIEDSPIIYQKTMEQSVGRQTINLDKNVSLFSKKMAWLILEEFPRKFVTFVAKAIEPDVEQHVSLLKKIGMSGLSNIEELLLLNRPMYVIDENQDILHPYVYMLLHKYKQPICNLEIEPNGVEKIIEFFTKHSDLDGAADVVSLLNSSGS